MITPLLNPNTLDLIGLKKTITQMISSGIHGLFILGTTGEAPNLSHRLRKELIGETQKIVANRIPLFVGITDTSMEETIELAHFAKENAADALVVAPPFYAPISQAELLEWLALLIPQLPLPVMLYNMPSHTKITIQVSTVQAMAKYEKVIGVKDSSGDIAYFNALLKEIKRPDFCFFTGPEILLADTLRNGGDGGVSGGANLYPQLFVAQYQAVVQGNTIAIAHYQKIMKAIHEELYNINDNSSGFLRSLKAAMSIKKLCQNVLLPPYFPFTNQEMEKAKKAVEKLEKLYPILQ